MKRTDSRHNEVAALDDIWGVGDDLKRVATRSHVNFELLELVLPCHRFQLEHLRVTLRKDDEWLFVRRSCAALLTHLSHYNRHREQVDERPT